MGFRRYWAWLIGVIVASFAVLGYYGWEIYQVAPPIPERVVTTDGRPLYTRTDITNGQNVWQSMGGQEVGSVWGHGGYTAPDWTADWLHREAVWLLDTWATRDFGLPYAQLNPEQQAALRARLAALILRTLDRGGGQSAGDGAIRLNTRLPHAVMSRTVGITYEECVRIIRDWRHDPAILTYKRGGVLTLLDRDALERELLGG